MALLDVNLAGEWGFPVAAVLAEPPRPRLDQSSQERVHLPDAVIKVRRYRITFENEASAFRRGERYGDALIGRGVAALLYSAGVRDADALAGGPSGGVLVVPGIAPVANRALVLE
jgi:hypothetical protein